jgi:hypothetical protein
MHKATMKEFHEAMKAANTVKRALKDDPKFREWYFSKKRK